MKKRLLAMLLSGLLLLSATACQTVPENEIDEQTGNVENDAIFQIEYENTTGQVTPTDQDGSEDSQNRTTNNIDKQGSSDLLGSGTNAESNSQVNSDSLTYFPCGDARVAFNRDMENTPWHVYVPVWDQYFDWAEDPGDVLVVEDYLWVIFFDSDTSTVMTQKIAREGSLLVSYAYTLPITPDDVGGVMGDDFLFNCYEEDCFYVFFLEADPPYPYDCYSIQTFQSTDGGRIWVEQDGRQAGTGYRNYLQMRKFFTNDIGIIAHRMSEPPCMADMIYVTFDGGETWESLCEMPSPESLGELMCIYFTSMDYVDGTFFLTLRLYPKEDILPSPYAVATFASNDLRTWNFESYYCIDPNE